MAPVSSDSVQDLYEVGPVVPEEPEYPQQDHGQPTAPPVAYSQPAPPPSPPQEPQRRPGLAAGVIAGLSVVAILAVAGVLAFLWSTGRLGGDSAAAPSTSAGGSPTTPATDRALSADEALSALEEDRARSRDGVTLDGRWALQLSSKYPGVEDPSQQAPVSGGHVFAAQDIWADYQARKTFAEGHGLPVLLLKDDDFGKSSSSHRSELFVVLADPHGIGSESEARTRCAELYPGESGDDLENLCLPRQLNPPS